MSEEVVVSELVCLEEGPVLESEIDHNGHMSQFFFVERAARAGRVLMGQLGLGDEALRGLGARLFIVDAFTRFYREQMKGAPLVIVGGVLSAESEGVTLYLELHNAESGVLSAVFTQKVGLFDATTRAVVPFPHAVLEAANNQLVERPEHGGTRSLNLDGFGRAVTLDELERRGHGKERRSFFGSNPYTVRPEDCGSAGFVRVTPSRGFDLGRMPTLEEREKDPAWQEHMRQIKEEKVGWVALENRACLFSFPRDGDSLKSFSVIIGIKSKTRHRKTWTFNVGTGALASTHEQIDLAFDLETRKGIEIRQGLMERHNETVDTDLA